MILNSRKFNTSLYLTQKNTQFSRSKGLTIQSLRLQVPRNTNDIEYPRELGASAPFNIDVDRGNIVFQHPLNILFNEVVPFWQTNLRAGPVHSIYQLLATRVTNWPSRVTTATRSFHTTVSSFSHFISCVNTTMHVRRPL